MGKRFYFKNCDENAEAWLGPFDGRPIPRIDEIVTIKCTDKIIRQGKVIAINWFYDANEVHVLLNFIA